MRLFIRGQIEKSLGEPGHQVITKKELQHSLKHGTYSIISAGPNPNDEHEKHLPLDHEMFKQRHEALRQDLTRGGHSFTEVDGHYGHPEKSFVVHHGPETKPSGDGSSAYMVHHQSLSEFSKIRELGKKYNQESVIHSHRGEHECHYVTGADAGSHVKGTGFKMVPEAEDYYTKVTHPRGNTSKYTLNFDWDRKHGMDRAVLKALRLLDEMSKAVPDYIPGGRAMGKPDSDFDPTTLAQGARHEMEHTGDPDKAKEIAKDHLAEDPDYYRKLQEIEGKKMKKAGAAEPGYYDSEEIKIKRQDEAMKRGEPGESQDNADDQPSYADAEAADPGAQAEAEQKEADKKAEKSIPSTIAMGGSEVSPVDTGEDVAPRDRNGETVDPAQFHRPTAPVPWVEVGPTRAGENQWKVWSEVIGSKVPSLSPYMHLRQYEGDPEAMDRERNLLARSIEGAEAAQPEPQEAQPQEEDPDAVVAEGKKLLEAIPQLSEDQLRRVAKRIWGDDYEYAGWADEDYIRDDVTGSVMDMVERALEQQRHPEGEAETPE